MRSPRHVRYLLVCWGIAVTAGCGGSDFDLAPVSGTVTLDGEPLVGALVGLQPIGGSTNPGPGSTGLTDANGRYQVKTINGEPGAVVGLHRVSIVSNPNQESVAGDVDETPRKERVPSRYNLVSKLTLEVTSGGNDAADFPLTSDDG